MSYQATNASHSANASTTLATREKNAAAIPLRRFLLLRAATLRVATSDIDRRPQKIADSRYQVIELLVCAELEPARPRERNDEFVDDPPRSSRHDQYAVGEEHRLEDAVGDEEHGLAIGDPDLLQLETHAF